MKNQLVEISPREIKFVFEVRKQSSSVIRLSNVTEQYVAFKVKTTSPKKYCVRPNVGVIKPKTSCEFTVTMQALKLPPVEMVCKDKFLIQSTVVPFGTLEEEISSSMFSKDCGNYIEETKIRVVLTSDTESFVTLPAQGLIKIEPTDELLLSEVPQSPVLLPINGVSKEEPSLATPKTKITLQTGVDNLPSLHMPITEKEVLPVKEEEVLSVKEEEVPTKNKNIEEPMLLNVEDNMKPVPSKENCHDTNDKVIEVKDVDLTMSAPTEDMIDFQSTISSLKSKLVEAEWTIERVKDEKNNTDRELEKLRLELATKRPSGKRPVQAGFPPLFVCLVAVISITIGYLLRS